MRPDNPFTNAYLDRHAEEAARTLEGLPSERAAAFLAAIAPHRAAALMAVMVPPTATAVLQALPHRSAKAVLAVAAPPAAEHWLRRLPAPRAEALLEAVEARAARRLRQRLRRPAGVVGAVAERDPLWLPDDITAAEALRRLRIEQESGCEVYVVGRDHRPVGWLPVGRLLAAAGERPVRGLMERDVAVFDFHTRLNGAAAHRAWDRVRSVPMVDADGRVAGLIRYGDLQAAARGGQEYAAAGGGESGLAVAELVWLALGAALTAVLGGDGDREGSG